MFVVSNLRKGDQSRLTRVTELLEAYLLANPDAGIRKRSESQVSLAIDSGLVLVIEKEGEICGFSFIYKFVQDRDIFSEIGTMYIERKRNGFRLQQVLSQIHLMQLTLEEYYTVNNFIFAVVTSGTASEAVLKNYVGMETWSPPAELKRLRDLAGLPFLDTKYSLIANKGCVKKAFTELRKSYIGGNVFNSPKGNEKVRFDLGWFKDDLLLIEP